MKTLDEIIAGKFTCTCGEIYKSRGLTAPDCFLCNEADTIKEIVAEQTAQMKGYGVLKAELIKTYKKIGDENAVRTRGKSYSGLEMVSEIENNTDFGIRIINGMVALAVDLVSRDKMNYDERTAKLNDTEQMKADILELRKALGRLNGCVDAFWNKRSYYAEQRICLSQIGLKELITKTDHYDI